MSLADILAQHSRDISARIQHQNDADEAVATRKATTLEEQFQNAKDAIESVGTEMASAGTAWHIGRKIYTKYHARKARLAEDDKPEDEEEDEPTDDGEPTFRAGDDETETPRTEAEVATDEPAPTSIAEGGVPGGSAQPELGDIAEEPEFVGGPRTKAAELEASPEQQTAQGDISAQGQARQAEQDQTPEGKARRAAQSEEEAKAPESATEPSAAETTPARDLGDSGSVEGQQARASAVENSQAEASTGTSEANPFEALSTRASTPLESGGSEPATMNEANVETPVEAQGASASGGSESALSPVTSAEDVESGARAFMNPVTGEARSAANIASRAADNSSVIDKGINGAKKVAGAVKNGLGGDASEAAEGILPEVGEALDFLGPLGLGVGIITSLIGLFEGLGHKPDDASDVKTNPGDMPVTASGAGIDTKALLEQAPKGTTSF